MVVLVILIALVLAAPYLYRQFHKDKIINFKNFDNAAALLDKAQKADSIAELKSPENKTQTKTGRYGRVKYRRFCTTNSGTRYRTIICYAHHPLPLPFGWLL